MIAARGFTFSVSVYALLHFITYFVDVTFLEYSLSVFGILTLAFSGWLLPFKKFQLQVFLIAAALLVLLVTSDSLWSSILEGMRLMRDLIGLLLIVPMISWVLKEEPYIEEIMTAAHNLLDQSQKFYFGLMAMTQVISHFLLFGAVPMMYRFIDTFLHTHHDEAWENYKGTAILRSFALSTMWVISIPSFVFAVDTLGATLWKSMLLGFVFAFAGTLLAVLFSRVEEKRYNVDFSATLQREIDEAMKNSRNTRPWNRDTMEFVLLFVSLFGGIFLVHYLTELEFLLTIPLVIIGWTFLYFLVKRRSGHFVQDNRQYFSEGIAKQPRQYSILLAAGLLILSLNQSGIGVTVINRLNDWISIVPVLNILFLLPFIMIFLGFIGLGPLAVIVLVTGVLQDVPLPYPPELIVLSITSGSVMSIILSPFVMPLIILSSINGLSGVRNGIRFNWQYAAAFYVLVQLFIQTVVHLPL
ncbi:hypothetical protein [Planococcus lenghuensis]|uniref:Permease n=1 Tax=Planococcus lenghuensis TaxID=2213202 RepID=A0A1Q2KY74_9BACL|nr:hypothetical protein [Planococcus lenghuensis]AQQ53139.1 hypothetical protein B0X71_08550 [Planococcus lenghuensis]